MKLIWILVLALGSRAFAAAPAHEIRCDSQTVSFDYKPGATEIGATFSDGSTLSFHVQVADAQFIIASSSTGSMVTLVSRTVNGTLSWFLTLQERDSSGTRHVTIADLACITP